MVLHEDVSNLLEIQLAALEEALARHRSISERLTSHVSSSSMLPGQVILPHGTDAHPAPPALPEKAEMPAGAEATRSSGADEKEGVYECKLAEGPGAQAKVAALAANHAGGSQVQFASSLPPDTDKADLKRMVSDLTARKQKSRMQLCRKIIWRFLDDQPDDGLVFTIFHTAWKLLVILSALRSIFADSWTGAVAEAMMSVDLGFTILYTVEFVFMLACCPDISEFMKSLYTLVDILVVVSGYVSFVFRDDDTSGILRLVSAQIPALRLLKITRRSEDWRLLILAMKKCVAPLSVPLYLILFMAVFSGSCLYWVENQYACTGNTCAVGSGPAFSSIPHAMWYVIVTVSTVGYGDVYPNTDAGKFIASVQIIVGICYMAMPLAIVGTNFSQVWDDRHRLLLQETLQTRAAKHGDRVQEIKRIFMDLDEDGNGLISLDEYLIFIESLDLGLPNSVVYRLFSVLDYDGSKHISFKEFLEFLFPGALEQHARKLGKSKTLMNLDDF